VLFRSTTTRRDDPNSFDENLLQQLIDETPHVLPVRDFLPSTSAVFSLCREMPVDIGGSEGFIDNLLVTNDGYIVIVETKLYRNPEATRDVVTQALQYGMSVGRLPMLEFEARVRRGQGTMLRRDESIQDCILRLANESHELSALIADDFEEALERHLRRGEFLLLVVSDGIRIGVERVTHWLNEQGSSSPFKFGLVELKFYSFDDKRLVIPRTVLKTREVSRHVVLVDIQPRAEVSVTARVTDEFQSATGGKINESRPVKVADVPMTKNTLVQLLPPESRQAASRLIEQLEILQFEPRGTASTLKFGFSSTSGEFHHLVTLDKSGIWVGLLKKDSSRLGAEATLEFRREANQFTHFYREDQLSRPDSWGCAGKYLQVEELAAEFAVFLSRYRDMLLESVNTME
jgi:hypothetical protein